MNEDALINYTKNYVCDDFNISPQEFKRYRNFVLLKTSDLADGNGAPSGVFSNCSISAKANLGEMPYNSVNLPGGVEVPYQFVMTFIYTKDVISVSPDGVRVHSQGSDIAELNKINVSVQNNSYKPISGVSGGYNSLLS